MILSDNSIKELVEKIKLIKPFNEKQLTPNGYDVSIEKIERINGENTKEKDDKYYIEPGEYFIVLTKEKVNMPKNIVGRLSIKTKFARKGIILSPGVVDAGFIGKLNLCFYNANGIPVAIEKGRTIVQLVFEKMEKDSEKTYEQRSGNYQNQKDIMK